MAGWEDTLSGIQEYEYEVHKLAIFGNELRSIHSIHTDNATREAELPWQYTFPEQGNNSINVMRLFKLISNLIYFRMDVTHPYTTVPK